MKRVLLFALSFVVLTVPLTWLWLSGGDRLYARAVTPLAREIYEWLGITGKGTMLRMRFINLVPFTTLMLLTPSLSWRRRGLGLLVGWIVLVLSHIALNGYAMTTGSRGQLPPVAALGSDAMPFLLWFVFARDFVRETMRTVRGPREPDEERPDSGGGPDEERPDSGGGPDEERPDSRT